MLLSDNFAKNKPQFYPQLNLTNTLILSSIKVNVTKVKRQKMHKK